MKKIIKGAELSKDNELKVVELSNEQLGMACRPLVTLLAQCLDIAALDGSCWVSLGCTKKLDSFVLTVHQHEGPLSLYASSFESIVAQASTLL